MSSYGIRQRVQLIRARLALATRWPWRADQSTLIAPGVPLESVRAGADWQYYGGDLVAESIHHRDLALLERAPEDLAFLCALVPELLDDRARLEFLIEERFVCSSREEVDHIMATNRQPWEPLAIVPADYEIVDERTAGAA